MLCLCPADDGYTSWPADLMPVLHPMHQLPPGFAGPDKGIIGHVPAVYSDFLRSAIHARI